MKADIEDLELELWFRRRERGEIKWTTKDGHEVPIKDMTDEHLMNTINHLRRKEEFEEIAAEYSADMFEIRGYDS